MIELCQADKISYLANVFAICGVDSRFSAQEVTVLKEVARRLNVTQEEATAARNLVASGHYELALLSDSRARRDNLEDMVMAALADGDLQPKESAPIEKLAKALRFAQVDMDMIARRAQARLDALFKASRNAGKTPPAPAAAAHTSSSTRAPLPKASPAAPASQPVEPEVPAADAEDAEPTAPPEPPGPAALPGDMAACVRCRAAAQDQAAYCYGEGESLNIWGCRLLQQPWRSGATWLKAGAFRPSGCFVFDREAIRALLAEAAAQVARCPHFDPDAMERALAALPSQAWPGRRWTLRPPEAGEPGTPLTVRRYRQGCMLHARQAVGGVAPVGDLLARRVIRDARRRGGPV
ncbi:MAG: hypothetical protein WC328_04025 [Kiritimatiellia bacterium]|jgi:uncharacterized tellurite resistance protein B-like protein|nr:hypothetical protein [Kiritimatiellia bacterium]MDD4173024.1 hypothetical protein [Kiritimatiellia bacterium]MDD4442200.1 hypothetical protein [Kiritimatiellia bacterium]MDX9793246.1 hypothetical protein [Kiritimatiellia bacterium]NLC81204.1 TerB family tellurite resistance protein [Lentisphaerota bacterium]